MKLAFFCIIFSVDSCLEKICISGYRIENRTTHFTLNDRKIRCKWISRFSLGGGGGGGRGGEGWERQVICIRLATRKVRPMLSNKPYITFLTIINSKYFAVSDWL